jgi:RNA polymerase sigma-70 factor, ECF subfamily
MLESNLAFPESIAAVSDSGAARFEDDVIGLFDELRIPLLRYLAGFPLSSPDSEDVVQETFLALFQYLRRGKSHPNVRGWVFRTAHNLALKRRQRGRRDLLHAAPLANEDLAATDSTPNPEDRLVFEQTQQRLRAVVRAMPEQNRWCLYLRAEGLRYREIASILDISLGSVSCYLERSLAQIARAAQL